MSMAMSEIIAKMENLIRHCDSMADEAGQESTWKSDAETLKEVVSKLDGECSGEDAASIVKRILEAENISQKELADKMGCCRQNVSQALNRGITNMRYDTFKKMVDALGYEVIVRKK